MFLDNSPHYILKSPKSKIKIIATDSINETMISSILNQAEITFSKEENLEFLISANKKKMLSKIKHISINDNNIDINYSKLATMIKADLKTMILINC
jgi:hypothetical protein